VALKQAPEYENQDPVADDLTDGDPKEEAIAAAIADKDSAIESLNSQVEDSLDKLRDAGVMHIDLTPEQSEVYNELREKKELLEKSLASLPEIDGEKVADDPEDLDLALENLVFYSWYVRGVIGRCTQRWQNDNYIYWIYTNGTNRKSTCNNHKHKTCHNHG